MSESPRSGRKAAGTATRFRERAPSVWLFVAVFTLAVLLLPAFALTSPARAAAPLSVLPDLMVASLFPGGAPAAPSISAKAAILVDARSGKVLYSRNANARLPIASTTKIMTAVIVLETLDPKAKVTVSANAVSTIGSEATLQQGEVLSVEDLLRALMIPSGNDAAVALAEAAAGSVPAFVAKMNAKAKALGLKNTHFVNPNGLTKDGHYSSAKDLATITEYAQRFPLFRRITDTRGLSLPTLPGQKPRRFVTTDKLLLKYGWVTGVKTGSTPAAGSCVVSSATQEGVSLIAVVLGASDSDTRWKEAGDLLKYGFKLSPTTVLVDTGQKVGELRSLDAGGEAIGLVAETPLWAHVFKSDVTTGVIHLSRGGLLRVSPGDILGTISFSVNGQAAGSVRLLAAEPVPKPTPSRVLDYWRDRTSARLVLLPTG